MLTRSQHETQRAAGGHRYGFRRMAIAAVAGLFLSVIPLGSVQHAEAATPPAYSYSFYMNTRNLTVARSMGTAFGWRFHDQYVNLTVILAFGGQCDGGSGVTFFRKGRCYSNRDVVKVAANFIEGFWHKTTDKPKLTVRIGTNNSLQVGYEHGRRFGYAVNSLAYRVRYFSRQVKVGGANDIEPNFSPRRPAWDWTKGYDATGRRTWVNFGTCDGCPRVYTSPYQPTARDWRVIDVAHVTYKNRWGYPFPESYRRDGNMAKQWSAIDAAVRDTLGYSMNFLGSLTQRGACRQLPNDCFKGSNTNFWMDNHPNTGWTQLYNSIPGTLPFSSDIRRIDKYTCGGRSCS